MPHSSHPPWFFPYVLHAPLISSSFILPRTCYMPHTSSILPRTCYMPHSAHPPWMYHPYVLHAPLISSSLNVSPVRATCSTHLILLHSPPYVLHAPLIITFGKQYNPWSSSPRNFLHSPVTPPSEAQTSPSAPCSRTPSAHALAVMWQTMFHTHTMTGSKSTALDSNYRISTSDIESRSAAWFVGLSVRHAMLQLVGRGRGRCLFNDALN